MVMIEGNSLTDNADGGIALLDEATELLREALRLRPSGHPDRTMSCANLADALKMRFYLTRDNALLDESMKLDREALQLCPPGHSRRAETCAHFASSLKEQLRQTGEHPLLDEAI